MPTTLHVQAGIEFRPELFAKADRTEWLDAVGAEIEKRGLTVKVGDGTGAKDVKNAADLKAAYGVLVQAAGAVDVKQYLDDLLQALDDVVKPTTVTAAGDNVDLTKQGEIAKVLGMNDPQLYGVDFVQKPEGFLNVVGVRLQKLAAAGPLKDVPYISPATFAGASTTSGRDSLEVEAVRLAFGADKFQMHAFVTTEKDGKAELQKLQKPMTSVAFGLGYAGMSVEEAKWDKPSHDMRMLNPFVSLTVEGQRMEVDPKSGERAVSLGRDTFFDVFYATKDPVTGKLTRDMLDSNVELRSRVRVDDESGKPTRVLIGMKIGAAVDSVYGVKSATKVDIRTDSPTDDTVAKLDEAVRSGKIVGEGWWSNGAVIDPIAQVFNFLKSKGKLKSYGGVKDALVLEPAGCARQVRGRYHLNETEPGALLGAFQNLSARGTEILALVNASAAMSPAEKADLTAKCNALVDRSDIVKRATAGLRKLDATMTVDKAAIDKLWPDQPIANDKMDVRKRKVVADALLAATRDFAALFSNEIEHKIAGNSVKATQDLGGVDELQGFLKAKANASAFMTWAATQANSGVVAGQPQTFKAFLDKVNGMPEADKLKLLANSGLASRKLADITLEMLSPLTVPATLQRVETVGPFLAEMDKQLAGVDKQKFVDEFASYLSKNGNDTLKSAPDKDAVIAGMRQNLVFGHLEVLHRMVEESGTLGQALWFDSVRSVFCNAHRSGWSNFIIDSFDMIEEYALKAGLALTKEQRASKKPLDPNNMLSFTVGNDFQIELGYEVPYTTAIDGARGAIDVAAASVFMDYALQKQGSGVVANTPASFTKLLDDVLKKPARERKAAIAEIQAFAKSKGSVLKMDEAMLKSVDAHARGIDFLTKFAMAQPGSTVNAADPATLQAWIQNQLMQGDDQKMKLLTDLMDFAKAENAPFAFTEKGLGVFDVKLFVSANQGQPTTDHAQRVEDLEMVTFVWQTLLATQQSVADFRGGRVVEEGKKHGLKLKWQAPVTSKGNETLEMIIPKDP